MEIINRIFQKFENYVFVFLRSGIKYHNEKISWKISNCALTESILCNIVLKSYIYTIDVLFEAHLQGYKRLGYSKIDLSAITE